jgi:hypothetical protein
VEPQGFQRVGPDIEPRSGFIAVVGGNSVECLDVTATHSPFRGSDEQTARNARSNYANLHVGLRIRDEAATSWWARDRSFAATLRKTTF